MKQSALMFSSFNITVNSQSQLWRLSLFARRHMTLRHSDFNIYCKQHLVLWVVFHDIYACMTYCVYTGTMQINCVDCVYRQLPESRSMCLLLSINDWMNGRLYQGDKMANCRQLQVGNSLHINQFHHFRNCWLIEKKGTKAVWVCSGEFL